MHGDDADWLEFEAMAPNGYALQAIVVLERAPSPGDFLIAGIGYPDDLSWSGYFGVTSSGAYDFKTYIGIPAPEENGLMDVPNFANA